jgi:integrase
MTETKTAWTRAIYLAKIDDFRFHDLRHTFASHFAMKGGNIYALAKILGHSNPKITLERTHPSRRSTSPSSESQAKFSARWRRRPTLGKG